VKDGGVTARAWAVLAAPRRRRDFAMVMTGRAAGIVVAGGVAVAEGTKGPIGGVRGRMGSRRCAANPSGEEIASS
jgi:hypothetical protein